MSDRIRTILDAGDAAGLPEIARALALDSDLSPEAAEVVFGAAKKDIAAATANVRQTITPPAVTGETAGHNTRHRLGVAEVIGGQSIEATRAGWAKAVAHVNRGRESLGA